MLLFSKKSFEECRNGGIKTRENRISLTRWKRRKSSSAVVEIVICFVLLNFRCLFDCNQFQLFSQSNREGVSSSLTNAKNHTFLSFSSFTNYCEQADFKSLSTFLLFNNTQIKKKKQNKTKQIQNILCKCGWDFDHFDQLDQNHAFSNHNPKRMTIGFTLRKLITISHDDMRKRWKWTSLTIIKQVENPIVKRAREERANK